MSSSVSSSTKANPNSAKRKATQPVSPPPVKRKMQSTTSKSAVASFFLPASQKPKSKTTWTERAPNLSTPATLLVGRYSGQASLSASATVDDAESAPKTPLKIAAFDLDSTLIATASGKRHADDPADWKWWDPVVPARLRQLHSDGYVVVLFSNQGGLTLHPDPKSRAPRKNAGERVQNFKTKANAVLSALDLPSVTIYAATGKDIFRKPRTGMWATMCEDLATAPEDVQLHSSFFIGDAGGRTAATQEDSGVETKAAAAPKDFSCSDRNFAHNVGIRFQTPEEYFHGHDPRHFVRDLDLDRYPYRREKEGQEPGIGKPVFTQSKETELVLFCGPPGAGKSTFYWKHLEGLGYMRVNQDRLKSKDKCFKVAAEHLEEGDSVAIDNTNPDPGTRGQWISLAADHGVSARCVWFKTPISLCEHNDAVRALNGQLNPESRGLLPKLAFNGFGSRFQEPKLKEGFKDIIEVDFEFQGTEDEYNVWSKYWV